MIEHRYVECTEHLYCIRDSVPKTVQTVVSLFGQVIIICFQSRISGWQKKFSRLSEKGCREQAILWGFFKDKEAIFLPLPGSY